MRFSSAIHDMGKWVFDVYYAPLKSENGKLNGLIGVATDITSRKKTESELEISHRNLISTLESMRDGFVSLDSEWRYTYMNNIAGKIFGREPSEMIGKHIWTEFPEGVGQPFHLAYEKAMKEQEPIFLEEYYKPYNKWFENRIYPNKNGLSIFFTDITERKLSEQKLRESEEKFRSIFSSTPVPLAVNDSELNILLLNDVFVETFGYNLEDIPTLNEWWPKAYPDSEYRQWVKMTWQKHLSESQQTEKPFEPLELRIKCKDGSYRTAIVGLSWLGDPHNSDRLVILYDITERKRTEEEKFLLSNALEASLNEIYMFDALTLRFTDVNQGALKNLGYTKNELLNMTPLDIKPDFTYDSFEKILVPLRKGTERQIVFETRHRRADGSLYPVEVYLQSFNFGDIKYFLAVLNDITERKLAEEEIRIKNRDLAKMFEISLGLIESLDEKSTLKKIVESANELLELDTGAIYSIDDDDLYLEVTTPPLQDNYPIELRKAKLSDHSHISKVAATGLPFALSDSAVAELTEEERIIVETRNLRSILYLPLLIEKQVIGVIILGTVGKKHNFTQHEIDLGKTLSNLASLALENTVLFEKLNKNVNELRIAMSEKNVALDALKESEERFHAMFEKHHAVMMLIEPKTGQIIDANLSAEKFYGYTISQLRQMKIDQINILPADHLREEIKKAASESRTYFNFPHKLSSGEVRLVEVFSTPIAVENETLLFSIIHDITEKRLAEEEVIKSQNQLRALAAKLEKIREEERIHLSRELHDNLGQSLTGLKMDVAWLGRKISKKNPESVETILDKTKSMSELIDTVINDVRRIALDLRPNLLDHLGLLPALNWLVDDFKKRTEKKCDFVSNVKGIKVDQPTATSIFRIFQEAFTNILRHSNATQIQFSVDAAKNGYVFTLKDNGKGISQDEIKNVNSLGLRGMKERAFQIGGVLRINGVKNGGSTITLTIPKEKNND